MAPTLTRVARAGRKPTAPAAAVILLAVAIAARIHVFGNPVVQIDEQFYLLVGGRMLHGALPYVDIFDRKPIGLFLIYAFARLVGGDGVIACQAIALLCAWGTALLLFLMARKVAPGLGALAAAALYLLWLNFAGGEAGQAPVFYNLPVAAAAMIALRQTDGATGPQLRRGGAVMMALIGLALQVKYSVLFEGLFFGLVLVSRALRLRRPAGALAVDMAIWVGLAVAPTLLVMLAYAALGHWHEWLFANLTSILDRGQEPAKAILRRLHVMGKLLVPLVLAIPLRRWLCARPDDARTRARLRFIDGWAASAILGVVLFGTWFNHYALPLFAPLATAAAPIWRAWFGRLYLVALLAVSAYFGQHVIGLHDRNRGDARLLTGMVQAAGAFHGCAFVYDGLPAFYDRSGSCLLTTRPFPAHLQALNERGATGIDQVAEVRRIMATRPERVMSMEPAYEEENLSARAEAYRVLDRDYVALYRSGGGTHRYVLYGLRGTVATPPAAR